MQLIAHTPLEQIHDRRSISAARFSRREVHKLNSNDIPVIELMKKQSCERRKMQSRTKVHPGLN